ncbi:MAG: hypothetical protein ACI39C_07370 [Dietzia sp.]
MTRITGREAREMLDVCPPWDRMKIAQTVDLDHGPDRAVLAGAAHDLAETVAWLYEREPDGHKNDWPEIPSWRIAGDRDFMDDDVDVWLPTHGGRIALDRIEGNLSPRQAVGLARALLAAAERARRGQ